MKQFDKTRAINIIKNLIIAGMLRQEIFETIKEPLTPEGMGNINYINASERTKERYLAEARQEVWQYFNENSDELQFRIGLHLARLDNLYRRCYEMQDYKTCVNVIKETNLFLGLNKQNINITGGLNFADAIPVSAEAKEVETAYINLVQNRAVNSNDLTPTNDEELSAKNSMLLAIRQSRQPGVEY